MLGHRSILGVLALCATACGNKGGAPFGGADGGAIADGGALAAGDDGSGSLVRDSGPAGCIQRPENFDVPGNGCDDDGNGVTDDSPSCDSSLALGGDAKAFASALDLCQTVSGAADPRWGIVSVEYKGSFSTGTPASDAQHAILPAFGDVVVPRGGKALGLLSTGWARAYDNPIDPQNPLKRSFKGGYAAQNGDPHDDAPATFPRGAAGCPIDPTVHDLIDLKLVIKAPANAQGFSFDFDFWSGEWPDYVCSKFNDSFIAYLTTSALHGGAPDNVSFDAKNDPVSVNNGFFDRCTPGTPTGCKNLNGPKTTAACPGGDGELAGTGFGEPRQAYCAAASTPGGATGWLTTSAPVQPGETITLELMIWDTGDQSFDSSVLLDDFRWIAVPTQPGTERPPR